MIRLRLDVLVVALVLCAAPTPAQSLVTNPASPLGSEARVRVQDGKRAVTLKGELLAVDSNNVWLRIDNRTHTIPRASVLDLGVRAHRYDGKRGLIMGVVGGAVTGLGMAAACGSVEDATGCGSFVAAWEGVWLLVTAVSALFMDANSWDKLPLDRWSVVAAYARYPQGVPTSLTAEPLARKP